MHKIKSIALSLLFIPSAWSISQNQLEETLYQDYQSSILSPSKNLKKRATGFSAFEQSLYVDALWDLIDEKSPAAKATLETINPFYYELIQKLRLHILRVQTDKSVVENSELNEEISNALQAPQVELKLVYLLATYENELKHSGLASSLDLAKKFKEFKDIERTQSMSEVVTEEMVQDLFHYKADTVNYENGAYERSVRLFMFCRQNREFPCLIIMKDINGNELRQSDGKLWTHHALAFARSGAPSNNRNGNTPAGIHTIDSVMPVADQQMSYGKFRRMMLDFVPRSVNEAQTKKLLPLSSHDKIWWKTASVARDIGRNLLRIHGSGKINTESTAPFFPFNPTSGCIAQRENTYNGVTYKDQRHLLDTIMEAMDLKAEYANESKIKGILYIMELDNKAYPVTLDDLAQKGIQ